MLVVGFPASLSPTSFHLSPTSFHLSPRLGACGRVPGRLVSHFLSFVSHFFSFVSQAGCLWSGSRLACLPLPFICLPSSVLVVGFPPACLPLPFICLPLLFCLWSGSWPACLPLAFICLPVLFICLPGWVLVVGFPTGLFPTSFHLSTTSFHLSTTSFQLSPSSFHFLSLRLGACGRVGGWLVSHFLPFSVLVVGFPAGLSPTSLHFSHFLLFVSRFFSFVSQAGCFPGGLSPTSLHLSPDFSPNSLLLGFSILS